MMQSSFSGKGRGIMVNVGYGPRAEIVKLGGMLTFAAGSTNVRFRAQWIVTLPQVVEIGGVKFWETTALLFP